MDAARNPQARGGVATKPDPEAIEQAWAAGASGAAAIDAESAEIAQVIAAALEGKTVLPTDLMKKVAHGSERLSAAELGWLQSLAEGRTTEEVAAEAGYSVRQMFRRLGRVYQRLGVRGRREALLQVQRAGLIRDAGPTGGRHPTQKWRDSPPG